MFVLGILGILPTITQMPNDYRFKIVVYGIKISPTTFEAVEARRRLRDESCFRIYNESGFHF